MTNCGPHTRQGIVMLLHAPLPKCTFWHLKYATLWGKTLGDILFAYSNLHWWCFMLKCMHEQEHQNTCYTIDLFHKYQNQNLRGWILATHIYENAMRLLYLPISMNGSQIMIHEGSDQMQKSKYLEWIAFLCDIDAPQSRQWHFLGKTTIRLHWASAR